MMLMYFINLLVGILHFAAGISVLFIYLAVIFSTGIQ